MASTDQVAGFGSTATSQAPASVDLDPEVLITRVDQLGWYDLQTHATAILARMRLVSEAPGVQRRSIAIARTHPESSPPTVTPLCSCHCPSLHDHWRRQLDRAVDADLADDGTEPVRFRDAVFRAAEDLHQTTRNRAPDRIGGDGDDANLTGPDRAEYICRRYQGIPAQRGSWLESRRAGFISVGAFRQCRSRNGYGPEMGDPQAPPEEIVERVFKEHYAGVSDREIARMLDIGRGVVGRILSGHRHDEAQVAA